MIYKDGNLILDFTKVEGISSERHLLGDDLGRTWVEFSYEIAMKSGVILKHKGTGLLTSYEEYLTKKGT